MNPVRYRQFFQTGVIYFFLATISFGQGTNSSTMWHRLEHDFSDAFNGSVHVFSRPLHWKGNDWITFGSVLAGAAVITAFEKDVRSFFLKNQSKTADDFAKIGETYGSPLTVVLMTGGIYLFGNIADNQWARETAVILTATLLPGGIYQFAAKSSAGRARPYLELGNYHFEPFRMEEDYYSFVSGHTLAAMGISFVLANRIDNPIAKGFFYSLGVIGGLSRLYTDDHWLSDVVLGGALAAASAHSALNWFRSGDQYTAGRVNWLIMPSGNGLSLTLAW
jgi:membrane-associated phospholipid phosphatase